VLVPTGYKNVQQRPAQDSKSILLTQEKTRKTLEKIIDAKIAKDINEEESAPESLRHTSNEGSSLIVNMYEAPVDPLEPLTTRQAKSPHKTRRNGRYHHVFQIRRATKDMLSH